MEGCVLLVDNDPDFLGIARDYLKSVGYRIMLAGSVAEAREILKSHSVHLMVIDLRLRDDSDDKDRSGLRFAKESARWIPKIVLTRWPAFQDVREAMKMDSHGQPPAIDFVNKKDGLKILKNAIQQAFRDRVRINWKLAVQFSQVKPLSFPQIASLIDATAQGELLLNRAGEVEDLFRRLFWDWEQIRIDRLIWHRSGRTALTVFAFAPDRPAEWALVVCGPQKSVAEEALSFRQFGPAAPGPRATTLRGSAETVHFAANVYDLAGADMENLRSLADIYRDGSEKIVKSGLVSLFEKALPEWHQSQLIPASVSQAELIQERLEQAGEWPAGDELDRRLQWVALQLPRLGLNAERGGAGFTLQFENERFSYPDPIEFLAQAPAGRGTSLLLKSPGNLSGDNVLIDSSGTTWLTEFFGAGMAPAAGSFAALECVLRFDLNETTNLRWLHAFELDLVNGPFVHFNPGDFEGQVRKSGRLIQEVRKQAERSIGGDADSYHHAVLLLALSRIGALDSQAAATKGQLARFAHLWISAMVICKRLLQPPAVPAEKGIRIDKRNRVVWIDGRRVDLRGIGFQLMCILHEYANQLCTRRLLIERAFGEEYDQLDAGQVSRLNVAIRRLREKVEADPGHPRYLQTAPGGGYRLLLAAQQE